MHDLDTETRRRAEAALGYRFDDPDLLAVALTHASVANDRLHSNERLEFLGDAILGAVVCEFLFHSYPDYLEGELTKIKSDVVSRRACAQISNEAGLTGLLTLGKGIGGLGRMPMSLAAAVLESLVAAIYLDGGLEPARRFILEHLRPLIEASAESTHQQNFKSMLQQHAQQNLDELPAYHLLDEKGPDHSKAFRVCVEIGGQRYEPAWGQNKKQAEQEAALLALREMELLDVDAEERPRPAVEE